MRELIKTGRYTVKRYEATGFSLIESLYPAKLKMPSHVHKAASFCFVFQGGYLERYDRKAKSRNPSTITIYPPQYKHSVDFENTQVRTLDVLISEHRYNQISQFSTAPDYPENILSGEIIYLINRLYRELRYEDISPLALEGIILEILAEAIRNKHTAKGIRRGFPQWIKKVDEYLHAKFSEPVTLEEIAEIAGVHSVHLARIFRKKHRCTIGEYIRRLRIDFVCRQLSESDMSFSEIALAAGFSDQSHFTRTFKAQLGITPSEYKNYSRSR